LKIKKARRGGGPGLEMRDTVLCCALLFLSIAISSDIHSVHIAVYNDGPNLRYVVSWIDDNSFESFITLNNTLQVPEYIDPLSYDHNGGYNHHVLLPLLKPSTLYLYTIAKGNATFNFTTAPSTITSFRAWVAADFGIYHSEGTVAALQREASTLDLVLHPQKQADY